jgi:5-methylcytosine-specific restriction enzyme B
MDSLDTPHIPPWPKFSRLLLEVLSDGQIWRTRDLKPAVMDLLRLSDSQRAVMLG